MENAKFSERLQMITAINRDFAARFVSNELPPSSRYLVRLNQSCEENPLKQGERVFLAEVDPPAPLTLEQVVDLLCRGNHVPEWIDISVENVDSEHTYFQLLCCGRFAADDALLYYRDSDLAPFGCKSPSFPPRWTEEHGRFDLNARHA